MRRCSCLTWVVALWSMLAVGTPTKADFGAAKPSKEEFERLPVWQPEPEGAGIVPRVDLRPLLPPPRDQGRQLSCTGWATAYACKTCMVARQRRWPLGAPPADNRVFSPAFIYNQINGGRDRGANLQRGLELIVAKGCATLAMMPYDETNFTAQPSDAALREAAQFRSGTVMRLTTGGLIRTALRQGYAVPIVIECDPEFCSGSHLIFRPRDREKGIQSRGPGDPVGTHALCVVGYDETEKAFLLMNSFGPRWCSEGFCWVEYDLMRDVRPEGGVFLQTAYLLANVGQEFDPHDDELPHNDKLDACGSISYVGLEGNLHAWTWNVAVAATSETLDRIAWVAWHKPGEDGPIISTYRSASFAAHGTARGTGVLPITGRVRFRDGRTAELDCRLDRKPQATRRLVLVSEDRYWGERNGTDQWQWTVRIRGNHADMADVKSVTYHLDASARNPDPVITASALDGFAFTAVCAKPYRVSATVTFRDEVHLDLSANLQFLAPPRRDLTLTASARLTDCDGGGSRLYCWNAALDGPQQRLAQIRNVRYYLPASSSVAREATGSAANGFAVAGTTYTESLLRAQVLYHDGREEELTCNIKLY